MQDVLKRFSSRKFIITIAGVTLTLLMPEQSDVIVQFAAMFIGAEGAKDLAEAVRRNR